MAMENRLKERIVGATVLMLLAVIFIPMLLDGPGGQAPVSMNVPLPDAAADARRTVRIDLATTPASAGVREAATEPATVDLVPQQQQETSRPVPDTGRSAKTVVERGPEPGRANDRVESEPPPQSPWLVQAGAFGSRANADRMVKTLKSQGFPAFIEEHRGGDTVHYRVRVSGYGSREAAEQAAVAIRSRTGQPARALAAD